MKERKKKEGKWDTCDDNYFNLKAILLKQRLSDKTKAHFSTIKSRDANVEIHFLISLSPEVGELPKKFHFCMTDTPISAKNMPKIWQQ